MSNVEQWEHNEQRAMETEITTLREQVEKLTKERDAAKNAAAFNEKTSLMYLAGRTDARQQLAALAEQNGRQSKALNTLLDISQVRYVSANTLESVCRSALSLPNLASPILNRIRAEGMREAINLYSPDDSAQDWIDKISARAAELEKIND